MNKIIASILALAVWLPATLAQTQGTIKTLHWNSSKNQSPFGQNHSSFNNCSFKLIDNEQFPTYFERIQVPNSSTRISLENVHYVPISQTTNNRIKIIADQPQLNQYISYDRGQPVLNIEIFPFRISSSGLVEKMTDFRYELFQDRTASTQVRRHKKAGDFTTQSVLSQGEWYKFKVPSDGVYKITGEQIANLNLDVAAIAASTFKVYGHPGGMLSEVINDERTDDLKQLPVELVDVNGNNRMDPTDFIRFYAEGPHAWKLRNGQYFRESNIYDDYAYIFLTFGGNPAQNIGNLASGEGSSFDQSIDYYNDLRHHEVEETNFIKSGRYWYGEDFHSQSTHEFKHTASNVRSGETAYLVHRFAARGIGGAPNCRITVAGKTIYNKTFGNVSGDYDEVFGYIDQAVSSFEANSSTIELVYTYNRNGGEGNAWIDYYTLSIPVDLSLSSTQNQVVVRSKEAAQYSRVRYEFKGNYNIWNVTDYYQVGRQSTFSLNGNRGAILPTDSSAIHFALFKDGSEEKAVYVGKVQNQNLHASKEIDFIIISHPDFLDAANDLAEFHRTQYKQKVLVESNKLIYNEFSAGKQDPVAIRDFIRMYYKRGNSSSTPLQNVLLIGDGSYDHKNRLEDNTNFIPTFQGRNTTQPISSYSSDDFYAILDEQEGYFDLYSRAEDLDIGVGRIPCRSMDQARTMVNKIIHYHDPSTFGDWQNRLTFLGDDQDGEIHMEDSDTVSGYVTEHQPVFNINKIYLDAYEQQSFGSGEKYPDVNVAITKAFEQGTLIFNYLGHGGTSGMAHERVVTRDEIRNWDNYDKLALMVTATCELSRFDDPSHDSPGELMLFNEHGGAVGLVTTMRLVQISQNSDINRQFWNNNVTQTANGGKYLGETFRITKNKSNRAVNQRNFSLLADPAMQLAIPIKQVVTTSVNDSVIGVNQLDTFKAFARIKITGEIQTPDGQWDSTFNGFVYPTVFDKFLTYQTLANDDGAEPFSFELQNGVLYRGKVSASKGKFSFQFVVPKDISYHFGQGKISYFAENGEEDAHGFESSIMVGGSITEIADDKKGPDIKLYLNDESWVFGGTTNPTPLLLCKVFDENGINTVGNGIGRDITAIIDAGTENEQIIVLNDFYQSLLDSYQEGEIRYNMEKLTPGKHTLKVRVWDVYNNASEDYTEFIVANDEHLAINHLLNFPNPFTSSTTFHFDHNKAGQQLDVLIQVVTPTGRIVKTFSQTASGADSHFDDVFWDGKDEFGDKLARGVYLYKVTVKSEDGETADATQKLVLLK